MQVLKFSLWCTTFVNSIQSFSQQRAEELSLMTLKSDPNLEAKLTFCLKNDMINFMNFNSSSEKSENLHFDGMFLSIVCNVWDKIIQTNWVKNELWFQKWHKKFGEFLHK